MPVVSPEVARAEPERRVQLQPAFILHAVRGAPGVLRLGGRRPLPVKHPGTLRPFNVMFPSRCTLPPRSARVVLDVQAKTMNCRRFRHRRPGIPVDLIAAKKLNLLVAFAGMPGDFTDSGAAWRSIRRLAAHRPGQR